MEDDADPALHPSDLQEYILAFIPIPSSLLSIFGSSIIVYMAFSSRKNQTWSPYTRLILAMSLYDLVFSVLFVVAPFSRPRKTSPRLLSYGTDVTCSIVGFLNQMCISSVFFHGMLSFYFLLTVRYRFSNEYIAAKLEPWAHVLSIGFPFIFACVAVAYGLMGELTSGIGCWVSQTPSCENGRLCLSKIIGWGSFGLPVMVCLVCLVLNNVVIIIYVRKQTKPFRGKNHKRSNEKSGSSDFVEVSFDDSSFRMDPRIVIGDVPVSAKNTVADDSAFDEENSSRIIGDEGNNKHHRDQARRLSLVCSQVCLYVIFYLLCNTWTGAIAVMESVRDVEEEVAMIVKFYAVLVLQATLTPLQGFLNMLVYIRPKYMKWRHLYPQETRTWAVRRSIFGEHIKPVSTRRRAAQDLRRSAVIEGVLEADTQDEEAVDRHMTDYNVKPLACRLPRNVVSSLTASQEDDHWMGGFNEGRPGASLSSATRFVSSVELRSSALDVISELEESIFEPIVSIETPNPLPTPFLSDDNNQRWEHSPAPSLLVGPHGQSVDRPICIPQRRPSPPPS